MKPLRRVVVIDDEPSFATTLKKMLSGLGYGMTVLTDSKSASALALKDNDLVLVDVPKSKISSLQVLKDVASKQPKSPIVLMSRHFEHLEDAEKLARKLKLNLIGAIEKPFRPNDLEDILPGT